MFGRETDMRTHAVAASDIHQGSYTWRFMGHASRASMPVVVVRLLVLKSADN